MGRRRRQADRHFPRLSSPGRKLTFRKDGKVLYALTRDGQMRLFSTSPDYKEVATLFGAGTDWVVASVTGEVDSSPNGRDSIYWQVGDVQFRYYVAWARQSRPGLLAHLLDGLR